jgi:hypothetical protein
MNVTLNAAADPVSTVTMLKRCLATNQALDLQAIMGQVQISRDTVVELLAGMVRRREVEVLCPVTVKRDGNPLSLHPLEHYRLIRPTDGDYLWETRIREDHKQIHSEPAEAWPAVADLPERVLDFSWLWPKTYAYSAG